MQPHAKCGIGIIACALREKCILVGAPRGIGILACALREKCILVGAPRGLGILAWCLLVLHLPALLAAAAIPRSEPQPLITGFHVLAGDPGAWPQILSSIGFQAQPLTSAGILVLRAGTPGSPQWSERVEQGAFVVLEGASDAAQMFGFRASKDRVVVGSVEDIHL